MSAPTAFVVDLSGANPDLEDWESIPSEPSLNFLGGSCECPNATGPCTCGRFLE